MSRKIEAVFLTEDGTWGTEVVDVPDDLPDTQDAYVEWAYSLAAADFRDTWHKTVVATYWWVGVEPDEPGLEEEE